MKVLVTGAKGFLGKHLVTGLRERSIDVLEFDQDNTPDNLAEMVADCNYIYHLAGVNRPKDPQEFEIGNSGFTEQVLALASQQGRVIPVVLSSSIQAELDNPYGISKKHAEELVCKYAVETGAACQIYRFPNLFGKWVRPDYNSAVATFCDRIARGIEYWVNDRSIVITLNYIDDVIESLCSHINLPSSGPVIWPKVKPEFQKSLGEIVDTLEDFKSGRLNRIVPAVGDPFIKRLYSTYLSYVPFPDIPVKAEMKHDDRGWLFELGRSKDFGQVFVSTTKPGVTRGNHYHHTKVERFCLVKGQAEIRFRKIDSTEIISIPVNDMEIQIVDIPPGYTHSITNVGTSEMVVLFWANEPFEQARPDTIGMKVEL